MENIIKICYGLGIYPEDLVTVKDSIMNKITKVAIKLSPAKQYQLYNYLIKLSNNENNAGSSVCTKIKVLGVISAGTGEFQTGDRVEGAVSYYGSVPHHDYTLKVNGDSMSPMLEDNQIIFIKKIDGNSIHNGQIVIAFVKWPRVC